MACITVLAGTNGAGKSSIGGAALRTANLEYFNPDEVTLDVLATHPQMEVSRANILAWEQGVTMLRRAIAQNLDYAFETTLGGNTVTNLLVSAAQAGHRLSIWYCGLESADLHIARVAARVAKGGHDIPAKKIRERFDTSRQNLLRLLPLAHQVRVFDNSAESDPGTGGTPMPRLLLALSGGAVTYPINAIDLQATPEWAKPLIMQAYELQASSAATTRQTGRPPNRTAG